MSEPWRALHPASPFVNLIPEAWRTARSLWPILLAVFVGGEGAGLQAVDVVVLLVFSGLTVFRTLLHWATLRYRMADGHLEIRSGLLNRRARTMDPARIQNLEMVRNIFHRWTGLVELRVETAGDSSTEGLLSALSVAEAERLQQALRPRSESTEEPRPPLLTLTSIELLAYGFSRRRLGAVAILSAIGVEVLGQLGPNAVQEVANEMRPGVIAAAILLALAVSWLLSAASALFRHYQFRIEEEEGRLVTEEGLTTRRRIEIPRNKVQLVRADEPLMRRLMGYGTVLIETAGLGIADGEVRQAEGVVPMVEQPKLSFLAREAAPNVTVDPWATTLEPAHQRALLRAIMGSALRTTFFALLALGFIGPQGAWVFLLVPLAVPAAWLDWRAQGWLVTDNAVITRRGYLTRQTWIIAREKLQSIHLVQGPVQRAHGLGRLVIRVAGSQVSLPDISYETASDLLEELSPSRPAPTLNPATG